MPAAAILDIDGTLVDTNYQHAIAWYMAFLKDDGRQVVLASSAKQQEVEHYLDLLDVRDIVDGWTTSADVERTKPAPDLVHAALERLDGGDAVMVGDTPWDVRAANEAGVPTIAVLTGGFSEDELTDAGAVAVFDSVVALVEGIADTPLGAAR